MPSLNIPEFAYLFGTSIDDFDIQTQDFIEKTDFRYRHLGRKERDDIILKVLNQIDSDHKDTNKKDKERWEKGWAENLKSFIDSGYDVSALIPRYVKPNQVVRLYRTYVDPYNPNIEINFFTVLRHWLFKKYMNDFETIYEFGCGPGYNLTFMAHLFPDKKLYGLDWTNSSIDILNILYNEVGMNIHGMLFDLFEPDYSVELEQNCGVFTIGSLEQVGKHHRKVIQYLIDKKPQLCVHIEPLYELYDGTNLIDNLAMRFHKKRNYLSGFLPYLQELKKENKIDIIKINRMKFGSLFHDGWSMVAWKPL